MTPRPMPLPFDPAELNGLSARLLESHHQNNYGGAVKRLSAIRQQLAGAAFTNLPGFELNGLKREELIAANSAWLHELYFNSLGGHGERMEPACQLALDASFGSVQRWYEEFTSCAKALGGGSGWMLLVFQPRDGSLVNQWAADHTHVLAGGVPILALDMYEHAYHLDFGAAAGAYVDAFMANIDWAKVHARYQQAVNAASDSLGCNPDDFGNAVRVDVRRAGAFAQASHLMAHAEWRNPATVSEWASEFPDGQKLVVYCVHGHEVSRATALRLRAAGLDAHFLRGGFEAWKAAGLPTQAKTTAANA